MSPKMENQMEKTWRIEREARVMGGGWDVGLHSFRSWLFAGGGRV